MRLIEVTKVQEAFLRYYSSQVISSVPVIRVPSYVKKYAEEVQKREALKQLTLKNKIAYRGDTSFPVISCTDKQHNFYLGQIYKTNYPIHLVSKYWLKAKSSGQKFTINPWDSNPSLPVLFNKKHANEAYFPRTFPELLSDQNVLQELKNKGYQCPTPVQVLTMPVILENKHVLLAAETGCGKTVAYLAPIIQNISLIKKSTKLFPNTPLALIVTPGRELAEQIGTVAHELSKSSDLNVRILISGGTKHKHLKLTENADVDILVASFGTLTKLVSKKIFTLTNIRHLVLDEADTLLDDSFIEDTKWLLRRIPLYINSTENLPPKDGTKLILVSSTYPDAANGLLAELFQNEDVVKIKSPYLHRVSPHIKQKFWRVDNDNRSAMDFHEMTPQKLTRLPTQWLTICAERCALVKEKRGKGVLLDLVKSDCEKKIPVMIFCTHSDTCDWASHFLNENGIENVKLHAGLSNEKRSRYLEKFTSGECNVLCCTDLASRGLDTQHVKHVINFDFPTSVSDYILRAGRVGRVGSNQGYVTNLIVSKAGVHTVQEIEKAVRSTTRIPDVDANIKGKIQKLYFRH